MFGTAAHSLSHSEVLSQDFPLLESITDGCNKTTQVFGICVLLLIMKSNLATDVA